MERQPARLRQAAEHVTGEPGVRRSGAARTTAAAEVDGRARERVVHRHDRVAVAGDPAPVAERPVERLAERERRVLRRVVRTGLEVAAPSRTRSKPAWKASCSRKWS